MKTLGINKHKWPAAQSNEPKSIDVDEELSVDVELNREQNFLDSIKKEDKISDSHLLDNKEHNRKTTDEIDNQIQIKQLDIKNNFSDIEQGLLQAANESPSNKSNQTLQTKPKPHDKNILNGMRDGMLKGGDEFSNAYVSSFLDKIAGDNIYLRAAIQLLDKPRDKWDKLSFKLDAEVINSRIGHSEYAFGRLLSNLGYQNLLELKKTIDPIIERKKNDFNEKVLLDKRQKINHALKELKGLNLPEESIDKIRLDLIRQVNEQLPEGCEKLTPLNLSKTPSLKIAKETSIEDVKVTKIDKLVTVSKVEKTMLPSHSRQEEAKDTSPVKYKMIINGMEVYMANAHRLSLIFKYINDQTDLDLETFKNTDNNPPFFLPTYQAQKMRALGITDLIKGKK